jgi:hypothetical protein
MLDISGVPPPTLKASTMRIGQGLYRSSRVGIFYTFVEVGVLSPKNLKLKKGLEAWHESC